MNYSLDKGPNSALVALSGFINEDSDMVLKRICQELQGSSNVSFSFAQVKAINSLGVRAWVTFLREVEEGRNISYLECVPDIIMQINMIPSFQGKARIESFFVNYVSPTTEKTFTFLLETKNIPAGQMPSPPPCPESGEPMETEELEEEYFAFLARN